MKWHIKLNFLHCYKQKLNFEFDHGITFIDRSIPQVTRRVMPTVVCPINIRIVVKTQMQLFSNLYSIILANDDELSKIVTAIDSTSVNPYFTL